MMKTANDIHQLIVTATYDQERLAPLIQQLSQLGQLDAYSVRQRLIGSGLAQIAKGPLEQLRPMANLLRQHRLKHWIVQPPTTQLEPVTIKALTIEPQQITFHGHDSEIILKRGTPLLAIVADMSGKLAEKQVKRLLVHTTYQGSAPAAMNEQELHQEIFKHTPIIDLYWLNDEHQPSHAVRIKPGSFDHRQLGDKASLSRNGNLSNLLNGIKEYGNPLEINLQFGLGFLPDCRLNDTGDNADSKRNQLALTRYGSLQVQISHQNSTAKKQSNHPLPIISEVVEASGLDEIIAPLTAGIFTHSQHNEDEASVTRQPSAATLPPPPEIETLSGIKLHTSGWRLGAGILGIIVVFFTQQNDNVMELFYRYGIQTGIVPALISGAALWSAGHFWRLKRRIENTPTSKARSAAMGMIEVHGRAKRLYALVSPMSQQPCVYYCLKKYRRANRDKQWQLSRITTSGTVPFIIEDDTGKIQIDPQGAKLSPKTTHEGAMGQSNILFSSTIDDDPNEKWKEEVIHEGSILYVMGFARTSKNGNNDLRQQVANKLRDLKTDRDKMMEYDSDGNGTIDSAEWDHARSDMEQQALQEKLQQTKERSNQQLVIGAPAQKGLPFIIAETESEANLTRNYSWYIPPLLTIGVGAFVWTLIRVGSFFNLF
jgi:hypothetical protein